MEFLAKAWDKYAMQNRLLAGNTELMWRRE